MAYQSLYRRYRSRTFAEIRGQDHVVSALRNAVANGTEGHAYLFSGPRGTGKTSTARIFAKALNCTNLHDGEPCLECESCVAIEAGNSYDLFELDAASNSGVEAMRDLIGRSIVASPGRTKVYILDEVHMLTAGASNALLKTLEEPPDHVKFVLATTDPHKVLPTIRSRTQHFDFHLISADVLTEHVRWVIADAGLESALAGDGTGTGTGNGVEEAIAYVVREGRGSARDTLSALDRVVAAGGRIGDDHPSESVLEAIARRDVGAAIAAVAVALDSGRDPRVLGEAALGSLRNAFLLSIGLEVPQIADGQRAELLRLAGEIGTPTLTRSLEAIGLALVEMRQAPDPRVPLEVALIRLCDPTTDLTLASLADRVDRLERGAPASGAPAPRPTAAPASATSPPPTAVPGPPPDPTAGAVLAAAPVPADPSAHADAPAISGAVGAAAAREELARQRPARNSPRVAPAPSTAPSTAPPRPASASAPPTPGSAASAPPVAPGVVAEPPAMPDAVATAPVVPDVPAPVAAALGPTLSAVVATDGDPDAASLNDAIPDLTAHLKRGTAAIFRNGRFAGIDGSIATFVLDNAPTRDRAERGRADVEQALSARIGRPITLRLVDESQVGMTDSGVATAQAPSDSPTVAEESEETIDLNDLVPADVATSVVDKLAVHFPGATMMEEETL